MLTDSIVRSIIWLISATSALYFIYCAIEDRNRENRCTPSDCGVRETVFFRTVKCVYLTLARVLHRVEVVGAENIPQGEGAMLLTLHTSHSADIPLSLFLAEERLGRVVHGLIHRSIYKCFPWLRYLGLVPGHREEAMRLLGEGHLTACAPGGVEEAIANISEPYVLRWRSASGRERVGFAEVLKSAVAPAIPVFIANGEETRFNPLFWIAGLLKLDTLTVHPMLRMVAVSIWAVASLLSIPIPSKVTIVCGSPLRAKKGETAESFASRCKSAMDELRMAHQPGGLHYLRAIKQRFK